MKICVTIGVFTKYFTNTKTKEGSSKYTIFKKNLLKNLKLNYVAFSQQCNLKLPSVIRNTSHSFNVCD